MYALIKGFHDGMPNQKEFLLPNMKKQFNNKSQIVRILTINRKKYFGCWVFVSVFSKHPVQQG